MLVTGFGIAQNYAGDTWAQTKQAGKGTISLAYVETPSFVYKNKKDQLTGICIDIMEDFVKWVNETKKVKVQSKFVGDGSSFRGMYDQMKVAKGGVFGLGNVTITEERKKEVKFSPSFITNFAILVTQPSIPTLAKMEEFPLVFGSLTAYTAKGTLNEKRINDLKKKYHKDMKIVTTTTSQETLEKVLNDPKGFAYLDMAFYLEAAQMKKFVKRHPVADQSAEQFGIVMPKTSDWAPLMDEFFKANGGYTASARYQEILKKHLGDNGVKLLQSGNK